MFITESVKRPFARKIVEYSDLLQIQLEAYEQFNNIVIASMQAQHVAIMNEEGFFDTVIETIKKIIAWIVQKAKDILNWFKAMFFKITGSGGIDAQNKEFYLKWKDLMNGAGGGFAENKEKLEETKISLEKTLHGGDFAKRQQRCAEVQSNIKAAVADVAAGCTAVISAADAAKEADEVEKVFDSQLKTPSADSSASASKAPAAAPASPSSASIAPMSSKKLSNCISPNSNLSEALSRVFV